MTTQQFDIAVIIPTICRNNLLRAVRSVYSQDFDGKIQILIGVDIDERKKIPQIRSILENECPKNIHLTIFNPGYSTSIRHGGIHGSFYGGSLRTILSFMANSQFITYLDDDDWFLASHIGSIMEAIGDNDWAYPYCWYADGNTSVPLFVDSIESLGPEKGIYAQRFGGFVRPSGMTINKIKLMHLLHLWSIPLSSTGDGEDRVIFDSLRKYKSICTEKATVCAAIDPHDSMHHLRMELARKKGFSVKISSKLDSSRK